MPSSVITIKGINPILNVLGTTQQLNYAQEVSLFQLNNSFIPIIGISAQLNMEYRNNMFSGFRWIHLTTSSDTHGSLTLQSFVNAQSTGIDIITVTESNGININVPITMSNNLDMNNNRITHLPIPLDDAEAATKGYVDTLLAGILASRGTV